MQSHQTTKGWHFYLHSEWSWHLKRYEWCVYSWIIIADDWIRTARIPEKWDTNRSTNWALTTADRAVYLLYWRVPQVGPLASFTSQWGQTYNQTFFKKWPIQPSFCVFSSFSHHNFNNTNWKSLDGELGIWTLGRRMVGADKTTELWQPPYKQTFIWWLRPLDTHTQNLLLSNELCARQLGANAFSCRG